MTEGLIRMAKDGESLLVHPSCVAAHEKAGWAAGRDASADRTHEAGDSPLLDRREICADLEAMGIEFDARWKDSRLLVLRDEARAKRDAAAS